MKKINLATIIIFACFCAGYSQNPAASPTGDDQTVVKISTNLIRVDATVTDKNGKNVTDLALNDFEVYENGEEQKLSGVTYVTRRSGAAVAAGPTDPVKDALPAGPLAKGDVRRTIAIVVDDLNLSFGSVHYTRKALRRFVDSQMEPGDLVAIIRTGRNVGALQQFTSDKQLLHAAIDKIRWSPFTGGMLDSLASVGQNATDISDRFFRESDTIVAPEPKKYTSILTRDNISDKKATDYDVTRNTSDTESAGYAQATLGTLRYLIGGMNKMPGRKLMMLFSDGLAMGSNSNKARSSEMFENVQDLVDHANRSSVVVYTFDTKGLRLMDIEASDSTYEVIDGHREQKIADRTDSFNSSQDGLIYFANQTGGKAMINSDNLTGGIQRAIDEQTGYYLLAYQPDTDTFDASKRRFNKLEVKVTRPGLKVSYRSGFFNKERSGPGEENISVEGKMAEALLSPFAANDISLNMNALYADDPTDGPYIRSFLHIDARNLTFAEDADGWKKASFDVAAVTFGDNGNAAENTASKYTIKTKGATYDTVLKNGFVYVLIMPVKRPGVYQYRVALRDTTSGKIGSASQVIEVPDLSKQKLAVSGLAVEGVTPSIWQNITQGKVGNGPGQMHIASTLLYDTVLKQFVAGNVLRYGYEVYNAKLERGTTARLETQARILQNNRVIVDGTVNNFDASAQPDPKHIRISGAVMLRDTLAAGDYVLQMIVVDTISHKRAVQLFPFEIIK